jgi:hypothetical protein
MEHLMLYAHSYECVFSDEGHRVACNDPALALEQGLRVAGVNKAYGVAPRKEMNLPASVSNSLLAERGSMQSVCNRTVTIDEMMAALGRKR